MVHRDANAVASELTPRAWTAVLAFVFALTVVFTATADAGLDTSGRWTGTWDWGATGVHMMLVPPGSSGYHSRVVWWEHRHDVHYFIGGMWGWNASSGADCSTTADSLFAPLSMGSNLPGSDVFCAGTIPMLSTTGKLFIAGGNEHGEVGIYNTNILDPDASSKWTAGPTMGMRRWYPTNTRLSDGTILVSSGSKYTHETIFGGRATGGTSVNSSLRRLGQSLGGDWDAAITTSDDPNWVWPPALEGQAMVLIDSVYTIGDGGLTTKAVVPIMFGGDTVATGSGKRQSIDQAWFPRRDTQPVGSDYGYYFQGMSQKFLPGTSTGELSRSDHTMTPMARDNGDSASVFVLGGRRLRGSLSAQNLSDVWRLYWHIDSDNNLTGWTWQRFTPSGGPSARFGHSAVYDPFHRRILVFGGTADSSSAIDNTVYALDVSDPRSPSWTTPTVTGAVPAARFGHRMALDPIARHRMISGVPVDDQYGALLCGGVTGAGLDSSVYMLWINSNKDSLRLEWKKLVVGTEVGGSLPSGRAFHTMVKDGVNDRWVVFGGDGPSSPDKRAWGLRYGVLDDAGEAGADTVYWRQLDTDADISVTHAAALVDQVPTFARLSDQFAADGSSKLQSVTGSPLLQDWFPFQWVLPDGSVFTVASGDTSYRLSSLGSAWTKWPGHISSVGINGGSAVMYAPGKVLTAGTRDTKGVCCASPDSRWIDTTNPTDTVWTASSNSMSVGRSNLNLVVLPNGQVLAVGGTQAYGGATDTTGARTPELWDPGSHTWLHTNTLAPQAMIRDYHSTALLLPDGRVLSTGGNSTGTLAGQDLHKAEIFCPPYLFKSDGSLAPRPVINGAADTIEVGHQFTLCTTEDSVTRVSLIAPGAPTHAFDENERFIPLTFTKATSPKRLIVTAPSGTGIAPPGPYLLFLTGAHDGSGSYHDVPSIATWVQVRSDSFVDNCDVTAPAARKPTVDVVGPTYADVYWNDPADDSLQSLSGKVLNYAFHYSSKAIITQTAWDSSRAASLASLPNPDVVGTSESYELTGLHNNTTYHLALRSRDDGQNYSALHDSLKIHTTSGGGGGSMLRGTAAMTGVGANGSESSTSSLMPNAPTQLSVRTERVGEDWRVTVRRDSVLAGVGDTDAGSLLFQTPAGNGTWTTERRFAPPLNSGMAGYCGLHDGQRTVFAGGFGLTEIAPVVDDGTGAQALVTAHHSRLGDLALTTGEPITPQLQVGDSLVLSYSGEGVVPEWDESWYALVSLPSAGALAHQGLNRGTHGVDLPVDFALGQNIPNPFRGTTRIPFALPRESQVRLEVFDLLGRRVRVLADGAFVAGRYTVEWDRRDGSGNLIHSGVFMYRMTAGSFREQRKLVIAGN
jgi:Domain of unknown function (DUF1929)